MIPRVFESRLARYLATAVAASVCFAVIHIASITEMGIPAIGSFRIIIWLRNYLDDFAADDGWCQCACCFRSLGHRCQLLVIDNEDYGSLRRIMEGIKASRTACS